MKTSTIYDCAILHLNKIDSPERAGNLTFVENNTDIPFTVERIYYLYDVPGGESRGAHGHKDLEQIVIAASGSFDITIDDGRNKKTVQLNRSYMGLNIKPAIWRDISNFSSGAICLVLASQKYFEEDYIRDYSEFIKHKNK